MKEVVLLTKAFIKNGFRAGDKGKTKIGLYLFIVLYFSIFTLYISHEAMNTLHSILLENLFIQAIILMDIILICMQSVISSLNMFYFSDDIEYVLPFPIKMKSLYMAKLNVLIFSEYIFEFLFFLAPLIYFGWFMNLGVIYYIKMLIVLLIVPAIICSLIAFFTVRLVGMFKNLKNKDRVQYISMIFALIIVVAISSISFGENGQGISDNEILDFVLSLDETINYNSTVLSSFINMFANFLCSNNTGIVILSLFKIIIVTGIFYVGLMFLNYKVYKKNIAINFNNGKKEKKNKKRNSNKDIIKKKSLWMSYVKKEFLMLLRTPMYFMQCVLPTIVFPLILCMPFAMNLNDLEALDMPPLEELKVLATTKEGICVIIIIIQFLYLMNVNQITAISRDNANATFMKYIPVSLYKQCIYKLIPGIIFNIIPTIYLSFILRFILEFKFLDILIIFVTLLFINIVQSIVLLLIDIRKPKINWDSESTVVKQNINIILGYFIQIIMCVIIVAVILLFGKTVLNSLIILNGLLICMIFILKKFIQKNEVKLFSKIY